MRVLLVAAGDRPDIDLLNKYLNCSDKTIAIDKGAEVFIDNNLKPDYVVGDFDSISEKYNDRIKNLEKYIYPSEKDYTDSDIAIRLAFKLQATEIIMLGMTGGRVDHMLGNLGLLDRCLKNNVRAYIIDKNSKIFLVDKKVLLDGEKNEVISFYPFGETVKGLNIKNAKYELEDYDLDPFESLCNSNEFIGGKMDVSFKFGKLLVIYSKE
ncbi:thiamine diphosphokinase [uncultured Clostridium sp.]|uniref:thiamine diphosphokinase n=1 Tax=uncultured Clostridium sp. TaxID=59620 RepID=UPI00260832FE|nr:thiamine diphosphokinase [uncultured Clostridium sp.]